MADVPTGPVDPEQSPPPASVEVAFQGMVDIGRTALACVQEFRAGLITVGVNPNAADEMASQWLRYFITCLLKG